MRFFGKAEVAAQEILRAFENPNDLPKPLAQVFIHRRDNLPCRRWSWRNQLLVFLHGYTDARGYRQWQSVRRQVRQGERAFFILTPMTRKVVDKTTGEERTIVTGFTSAPVFGYEQTEGHPLPPGDHEVQQWVERLPLLEVARSWGLDVEGIDSEGTGYLGLYLRGKGIGVGVKNLSTWTHELVHAADDRNGTFKEKGQHWRSETVAELGGAVLLRVLGHEEEADLGGCFQYVKDYAAQERIEVIDACGRVLERVCAAVALILDTAEDITSGLVAADQPITSP